MLINFVDATNDANHYTKPPPTGTGFIGHLANIAVLSAERHWQWAAFCISLQDLVQHSSIEQMLRE